MTFMRVVLPAPLGPISPTISPGPTTMSTPSSAAMPPKRIATPLGTLGELLYAINPKSMDYILNSAYKLFPDSRAAKGEEARTGARPADATTEEASREQVAFAYLMRGVHW